VIYLSLKGRVKRLNILENKKNCILSKKIILNFKMMSEKLQKIANEIRFLSADMVEKANSGHP